jgi:hypothetical protein
MSFVIQQLGYVRGTRCAFGKAESWDRGNVISTRVGIPSLQHACDSQAFSRSSRERRGDSAPEAVEVQDVSVQGCGVRLIIKCFVHDASP